MLRLLLALVVLAVGIAQATAQCSCTYSTLHLRVCEENPNTTFFRGIVETASTVGSEKFHRMKKVKRLQDVGNILPPMYLPSYPTNNKRVQLLTPVGGCNVPLTVGSEWLIEAYEYNGPNNPGLPNPALFTTSCEKSRLWPSDPEESKLLTKLVKKPDCTCTVRSCQIPCTPAQTDDECITPQILTAADCDVTYRRCKRCGGVCQWWGRPNYCVAADVSAFIG